MIKGDRTIKIILILLGDFLLLYAALLVALVVRYWPEPKWEFIDLHITPFTFIFLAWLVLFGAFGLYDIKFMKNGKQFLYRLLRAMATNAVLTIFVFYLVPLFELEPRRNLIIIAATTTIFIFLWRFLFNVLIIRTPASRVLFFGDDQESVELADYLLKNPQLGQKPVAFMSPNGFELPVKTYRLPCFTQTTDLRHVARDFSIDVIAISHGIKENKALVQALFQVVPLGISVLEFTKFYEMLTGKIPLSLIGEVWFLENLVGTKKPLYEFFKRAADIVTTFVLAVPTVAILPFVAAIIKLESGGPVFFRQKRVGKNGTVFLLTKFRSMVKYAEKMDGLKGKNHDARHTIFGSFLRKIYLDELPQVWNIFRGEMSFVGPRPERPEYVEELKKTIPFYEMRLLVPPGITGWAQINMENDASVEDAPEKMQYDLYYIKNRSFILDLLILLQTISAILRRQGR